MDDRKKIQEGFEASIDLSREVESRFPNCPVCSLPTVRDDDGNSYCPSCGGSYLERTEGRIPKKKKKNQVQIITLAIVSLMIFIILSFGLMAVFFQNTERGDVSYEDVARVRGLDPLTGTNLASMTREEYFDLIAEQTDPTELKNRELLYKCLLIIDGSWSLNDVADDRTQEGPVCFLDNNTVYVIDNEDTIFNDMNLCMAYARSLQELHFNISIGDTFDSDTALSCISRGDALLTSSLWADEELDLLERLTLDMDDLIYEIWLREISILEYQNECLGQMALFSLDGGYEFVRTIYELSGWKGVNSLHDEKPPLSTEHILHPLKYLEYERPVEVTNDIQDLNMDLVFETTVGEKLLVEMMPELKADPVNFTSDIGWGGDRFSYLENNDAFLSIFTIEWDTKAQNADHLDALKNYIRWKGYDPAGNLYHDQDNSILITSESTSTSMYMSNDPSLLEDILIN